MIKAVKDGNLWKCSWEKGDLSTWMTDVQYRIFLCKGRILNKAGAKEEDMEILEMEIELLEELVKEAAEDKCAWRDAGADA